MAAAPRLLLTFGILSLAAILLGAWVANATGVPASVWLRNLAAWVAGGAGAAGLAAAFRPVFLKVALWAAPAGLAVCFLAPGQEGVHRWVDVGPVHMNMAMTLLPAGVVALSALARGSLWPWLSALAALVLLAAQPDASQATALAAAVAVIAWRTFSQLNARAGAVAAAVIAAVAAWLRPDPLEPVAEVELIIQMAFGLSPVLAALALVLLAAVAATPGLAAADPRPEIRAAAVALGALILVGAVAPFLGAFPTPFVGMGMSPIVGAWLGVGLLAGLSRKTTSA